MTNLDFSQVQYLSIDETSVGQRLDNFLIKILKGVPKSRIYRLLRKGEIRVNKKRVSADYRLQNQDVLRLAPIRTSDSPEPIIPQNRLDALETCILYEDEDLLILNKPSGLASHGGSGDKFGIIEMMRAARPYSPFLELVHRIDKPTSGCLILAKNRPSLLALQSALQQGEMQKKYLLLVAGQWPKHLKMVDKPIDRSGKRSGEHAVKISETGKAARTEFKILKSFKEATLLQAILHSGRTHQIRAHAASVGFALVGDDKYGERQSQGPACKRLFLHASYLGFKHPKTQKRLEIEAGLPEDLEQILQALA